MHPEDHQCRVFCAALQGFLSMHAGDNTPYPSAERAVKYAREIVKAAYNNDRNRTLPDYTGPSDDPLSDKGGHPCS